MPQTLVLTAPHASGILTDALLARIAPGPWRILAPGDAAEHPAPPEPAAIAAALGTLPVDANLIPSHNRRKRLLVADMDSTVVTGETLDELAAHAGVGDRVAAITYRSMAGELDFAQALHERVALLQGLPLDALERTWDGVRLTPGARTLVATMRAHGATAALVSGGFTWFTARVAALCGFDHHRANTLLDDGQALLGRVGLPVLDRRAKRETLQHLAATAGLDPADTLAVGDGANDLDMIQAAGLGVAYHAKPIVAQAAQARIDHADLRALLYLQGFTSAECI